jgi:hypothetical protein
LRKKNKDKYKYDVQYLYDNGKVHTQEFYIGCTSIIKRLLIPYLIYKGYFKNGVRQSNFDEEDVEDCFTYVFDRIINRYDSSRMGIASFIHTWIRGYGTVVTEKQHRVHNYLQGILSLDENIQHISEEYKDPYTCSARDSNIDYHKLYVSNLDYLADEEIRKVKNSIYDRMDGFSRWSLR